VLLFPEGALALNPSAAAVLELCDGTRCVADVVGELQGRFPGADLGDDVNELLDEVAQRGLIRDAAG